MKIIDILVDIANNGVSEKTKHFKYFDRIDEEYDIRMVRLEEIYYILNYDRVDINDEVEIIEDTPKEKLTVSEEQMLFNNLDSIDRERIIQLMKILQPPKANVVISIDYSSCGE